MSRPGSLVVGLLVVATVGLGFGARSLCRDDAFREGRVHFFGNDAWYHMRRVDYALENGYALPDFPEPDPYLNYPDGGAGYWGPAFDWSVALVLDAAGASGENERESLAAILPALLGGLCSIGAFALGFHFWGARAGVLTAAFLAILPGHISYSQLGNLDHHVAESLFVALVFFGLLRAASSWPWTVATSVLILGLFMLTPFTSLMHMGVLWAAMMGVALGESESRAERPAYSFGGAAVLLLVPGWYWIQHSASGVRAWGEVPVWLMFERYSLLQPALLLLAGLSLLLAVQWRRGERSRLRFRGLLMACGAIGLLLVPSFVAGFRVLARGNPDLQFTSEMLSLLTTPGQEGIQLTPAIELFSLVFLAFPMWCVYLYREKPRPTALLVFSIATFGLVLLQQRFVYTFAFAMALALARLAELALTAKRGRVVLALVMLVAVFPMVSWIDAFASGQRYHSIPDEFYDLCTWMKEETPTTRGFHDTSEMPEYGVMASWDLGGAIVYLAERPVVADPFNHGFEVSGRYFTATDGAEARALLDSTGARYAIPVRLSHPYLQEMFLAYSRRKEDHPLRRGQWHELFVSRLLSGEDKAFGHRRAYTSESGAYQVFEVSRE